MRQKQAVKTESVVNHTNWRADKHWNDKHKLLCKKLLQRRESAGNKQTKPLKHPTEFCLESNPQLRVEANPVMPREIVILLPRAPCRTGSQNSSCRPRRCCLRREASPSWCRRPCSAQRRWRRPRQTACRPPESGSASDAPSRPQNTPRWWRTGPLEGGGGESRHQGECVTDVDDDEDVVKK